MARLTYGQSIARLKEIGYLGVDERPPLGARMPQYDDEEPLGVTFFRAVVEEADLSGLSLPRTYFGRSEITAISFANSDLSESSLCWNDFIDVSFEAADLSRADMRASNWTRVSFKGADLRGADLRRSFFEACDFTGALMQGAVLTDTLEMGSVLSAEQLAAIAWADEEGPEPNGG